MPVAFLVTITVAPGSASQLLVLVAPQTVAEVSYAYMLGTAVAKPTKVAPATALKSALPARGAAMGIFTTSLMEKRSR